MTAEHNSHGGGPGHEKSDANIRVLAIAAAGLVVLMLVGMFAMRMMYVQMADYQMRHDPPLSPLAAELPAHPPEPRLQVKPADDLVDVRAEEQEKLSSYGWVEPNAGVVRIPVERAMELLAERGLPTREGNREVRK
jgi:hypothetical protein